MTPAEREVLRAEGLTHAQRVVLLHRLDQPELRASELAKLADVGPSTARRALAVGAERGLLPCSLASTPPPASEHPARQRAPQPARQRARAIPAQVDTSAVPAEGEQPQQLALLAGGAGAPPPPTVAKRKGRALHTGTGLDARELATLGRQVVEAREAAGLDTRLLDSTKVRAVCAALLRKGLGPDEVVAYAPRVPVFSVGAYELEANRGATALAPKRPPNFVVDDREARPDRVW